ncbi:MAG: DivIVA domain-containing protein [Clostridia bacterium]
MSHHEFLQRRFRTRWQGYDPEDVQAALRDAESRQAELEQQVHDQEQELERLQAEVGRAYTAEASIAQAIVTAQQVGAALKDQAASDAEALRARAEQEATRIIREAREEARVLVAHATTDARGLVREAEATVARLSGARHHLEADLRAVAAAGLDLAQGLVARLEALQGLELPRSPSLTAGEPVSDGDGPHADSVLDPAPIWPGLSPETGDSVEEPARSGPSALSDARCVVADVGSAHETTEVPLFLRDPTDAVSGVHSGDTAEPHAGSDAPGKPEAVDDANEGNNACAADTAVPVIAQALPAEAAPPATPWAPAPLSDEAQERLRDLFESDPPPASAAAPPDRDGLVVGGAGLRTRSMAHRLMGFWRRPL